MRRSSPVLTAISTMVLLAGSAVGVTAQSPGMAPEPGALATGQTTLLDEKDFTQSTESDGSLVERGRTFTLRSEMSDPR